MYYTCICKYVHLTKFEKLTNCLIVLYVCGKQTVRGAGVYIIDQSEKKYEETEIVNPALWKKNMKFNIFFKLP